jgi:hypothetical protein
MKNKQVFNIIIKPVIKISFWNAIKLRIIGNALPEIVKVFKDMRRVLK